MSWTDWLANLFRYKPKPNYWETLYREQLARADEVLDKLVLCQSESSQVKSDLSLAVNQISQLNASIKSLEERNLSKTTLSGVIASLEQKITALEKRNQALQGQLMVADTYGGITDSLSQQLKVKEDELIDATSTIGSLRVEIDTLKSSLAQAIIDITPAKLEELLKAKYPEGSDVAKVWDEYASVTDDVFAVKLIDPVKEISALEFRASILNAFPNIKFNSMLMDNRYFCPSCADIIRVIRNNWGNLKPYVPERGDCNWFAERLRVHFNTIYLLNIAIVMVGMAPFGLHAWSIIKGSDGIVVCEPQNDLVVIVPEIIEGYIPQEIIIA